MGSHWQRQFVLILSLCFIVPPVAWLSEPCNLYKTAGMGHYHWRRDAQLDRRSGSGRGHLSEPRSGPEYRHGHPLPWDSSRTESVWALVTHPLSFLYFTHIVPSFLQSFLFSYPRWLCHSPPHGNVVVQSSLPQLCLCSHLSTRVLCRRCHRNGLGGIRRMVAGGDSGTVSLYCSCWPGESGHCFQDTNNQDMYTVQSPKRTLRIKDTSL